MNPAVREADLLSQVKWLLTLLERRGMVSWTRVHVMPIMRGNFARGRGWLSKNVDMAGFADIEVVAAPNGTVGYMELKSARGILSEEQERFRDSRTRVGAKHAAIRSLDEAVAFLKSMGVPVDRVIKGLGAECGSGAGGLDRDRLGAA